MHRYPQLAVSSSVWRINQHANKGPLFIASIPRFCAAKPLPLASINFNASSSSLIACSFIVLLSLRVSCALPAVTKLYLLLLTNYALELARCDSVRLRARSETWFKSTRLDPARLGPARLSTQRSTINIQKHSCMEQQQRQHVA